MTKIMSEGTKAALDKAVQEHLADEMNGAFMTEYVLTVAGASAKEAEYTEYLHACTKSSFHSLYGLAQMTVDHFSDTDDEDD